MLRFRRGEELRVVLGSGCFAPPGLVAPVEATLAWRGADTDPFSLQLESLLRRVAEQAHVPTTEELGTYGGLYFKAVEHRQALEEIAAPFVKRHERDHEIGELELVTDEKLIKRAVADFTAGFRAAASVHQRQKIGSAGGNFEDRVHYVPELGVWGCFGKNENRYWQGFGVDRPDRDRSLGITVEINPPCTGIDRKVGGAIARERSTGALHLVHRGRIGGGRKGIGAELFWTCFRGGIEMSEPGRNEPARVVAVARIGAPSMARDVATFVHEVARIKRAAS